LGFRLALGHASAGQVQGGGAAKQVKADGSDAGRRGGTPRQTVAVPGAGAGESTGSLLQRTFKGIVDLVVGKK